MVVFEDIRRFLLYQRLNPESECHVCKRKFTDRIEHVQHTRNCEKATQLLKCDKCGKTFTHVKILQLHLQFHNLSESALPLEPPGYTRIKEEPECINISDTESDENNFTLDKNTAAGPASLSNNQNENRSDDRTEELHRLQAESGFSSCNITPESSTSPAPRKVRTRRKPVTKKQIGLTKIRMEDCQRCDECSCIYIDPIDYYKHMRNFHKVDVTNQAPIQQSSRPKRKCQSCCKQCRGGNCTSPKRPRATQLASNLIFRINMQDNIQNRWSSMMSQQLTELPAPAQHEPVAPSVAEVNIKPDPDTVFIKTDPDSAIDLSHLLSQVEVKIKTEPPDEYSL